MNNYTFVFDTYRYQPPELSFQYHYENDAGTTIGSFTERYRLPTDIDTSDATMRYVLQTLHLIVGISYYKSLLGPAKHPYQLDESEANYLNEIYGKGLGEYSYVNKITQAITPFTPNTLGQAYAPRTLNNSGAILGIGGGKDSIVTAEIMKAINVDTTVLDVATRDNHGQAGAVMDITGLPQLRVERYVDAAAIGKLNQAYNGMNGHVPLSVILAWVGIVLAHATGKRYVLMANEAATSSGNVQWNGREINHQWAKSYEAEKLTQDFVRSHISPDLWYFSPIRPYGSLAVMELFAKFGTPYYQDFTSCNLVLRIDPAARPNGRWCTQCAKCLSTWLLLSSWLSVDQLVTIFGRNLFEDTSLRPILEALVGLSGHKPLDCVGTTDELRAVTRNALESGADHPLLQGIHPAGIPGPDVQELTDARSSANIPPGLADTFASFVDKQLTV